MKISFKPLVFVALVLGLIGCGDNTPKPTITQVALTVPNVIMLSGSSQNISADVTGTGTFDPTVNWTATDGTLQKTTGALNTYTAPTVTVSKTVTVTATSKADTTKFGVASITINPIPPNSSISTVTASAAKSALAAAEVTALTATVTGTGSFSNAVTWSISSGDGTLGTASGSSINFTAPSKTTASTTVIKATSTQDPSKFGEVSINTAALSVTPPTVSISSPSVDVFTKGAVTVQVVVTGAPDSVDLLKDGTVLATLPAPYTYTWDTSTEPEKTYSITAKAKKAGTADVTSTAKQITVDRTAPTLVSRVPASGAVNVFLADEISATFSEPLLASSVSTSSAQLKIGSNVVTSTATLDTAGTKLVLKPTLLPALTATINVVLNGLTDRAGNALVVPNSSFNAPDWQAPGSQPLNQNKAFTNAVLKIDSSGNAVVVWVEFDSVSATFALHAKRWNGTTWTELNSTGIGPSPSISMALDSMGNPIVAWAEYVCCANENKYDTYVKKWDGTAWVQLGGVLDVNTNVVMPSGFSTSASIAIDSNDNPMVTWSEPKTDQSSYDVYAKKWDGTNWVSLGTILDINAADSAIEPVISLDSSNNPILAWKEGNPSQLYVKRWNGSAWTQVGSTALNINTSKSVANPAIATDSSGKPTVAWSEDNGTVNNVFVKRWNGSAWTQVGNSALNINPSDFAFAPSIALDSSGNPTVAWTENDGTSYKTYVKRWNASAWAQAGNSFLNTSANNNTQTPAIALDSSSNPIMAWIETVNSVNNVYVKRLNRIP